MSVYRQEVNVYNSDAIDDAINEASSTASNFITEINDDGIYVHQEGEGPNDTQSPSGWHISNVLELIKNGVTYIKAWLNGTTPTVRLGQDTSGHADVTPNGLEVYANANDNVAHFGADGSRIGKGDAAHLETSDTYFNIVSDTQTTLVFAGIPDNPTTTSADSQIIYTADAQVYIGPYPGYEPPDGTMQAQADSYGYKLDRKPIDGSMSSIINITAWTSQSAVQIDITDVEWWLASGTVNGISSWWLSTSSDLASEYGVEYIDVYYTGIDIVPVYVMGMPTVGIDGLGKYSMSEGYRSNAIGSFSHAEGKETEASGLDSHSEGSGTAALGECSHAEGLYTTAKNRAHAEGEGTEARGAWAHAEGFYTVAEEGSHAEGFRTEAYHEYSHSEGRETVASAKQSHAQNFKTIAASENQTAIGKYNVEDAYTDTFTGDGTTRSFTLTHTPKSINFVSVGSVKKTSGFSLSGDTVTLVEAPVSGAVIKIEYGLDTYAFIIGNGFSYKRSNALGVKWDGTIESGIAGIGSNTWVQMLKGRAALYVPKDLTDSATSNYAVGAVVLETAGGGAWAIANYNDESLKFVYISPSNKASGTNTVTQFSVPSTGILTQAYGGTGKNSLYKIVNYTGTYASLNANDYTTVNLSLASGNAVPSGYSPVAFLKVDSGRDRASIARFGFNGSTPYVTVVNGTSANITSSSTITAQVLYLPTAS